MNCSKMVKSLRSSSILLLDSSRAPQSQNYLPNYGIVDEGNGLASFMSQDRAAVTVLDVTTHNENPKDDQRDIPILTRNFGVGSFRNDKIGSPILPFAISPLNQESPRKKD